MYKVGIIGVGFVGNALKVSLEKAGKCELKLNDPAKGYNDDLSDCDIGFCCIHVPTIDGKQDLDQFDCIPKMFSKNTIVYIKTTILPGTSEILSQKYDMEIHFIPEFLRERFAVSDNQKQQIVCTSHPDKISEIFGRPQSELIMVSDTEAEWAKYVHNCLAVNIIAFMNGVYDEIRIRGQNADIDQINLAVSASGFINTIYQHVPGPDGKLGYGGKCFPKDINALGGYVKSPEFSKLIGAIQNINNLRKE